MPTQKVPAISVQSSRWQGPGLIVFGALLGAGLASIWLVPRVHDV